MITCETCEQLISAMVDGEASRQECAPMYAHLAECDRCDAFMRNVIDMQVDAARRGLHKLSSAESEIDPNASRRHIPSHRGALVRSFIRKRIAVPVPVLGTALIALGLVVYALTGTKTDQPVEEEFRAMRVGQSTVAFPVVRIP